MEKYICCAQKFKIEQQQLVGVISHKIPHKALLQTVEMRMPSIVYPLGFLLVEFLTERGTMCVNYIDCENSYHEQYHDPASVGVFLGKLAVVIR